MVGARHIAVLFGLGGCAFDAGGLVQPDAVDAAAARFCAGPDLVGCYEFEQEITDGSSFGNHGTMTNAVTEPGRADRGLTLLVGPTSLVAVPDSASLDQPGPLSIELWLRADAVPPATGNARAGLVDDNGQWGLFLTSNLEVRCVMAGGASVTGLAVTLGRWTHLACVYDRATIQLYQDGVAGPAINATLPNATTATDGVRLGQDSPSGDPLTGALDDVRIWRVARTAEQISGGRAGSAWR